MMSRKCSWSDASRARLPGLRATGHTVSLSLDSGSLSLRALGRCTRVGREDEQTAPLLHNLMGTLLTGRGAPCVLRSLAFSPELGGAMTPFSGVHV